MSMSRRAFVTSTVAAGMSALVWFEARGQDRGRRIFQHGVASGDPLADRVVIWTRVTAPAGAAPEVTFEVASDPDFRRVVARGTTATTAARDHTVKLDLGGLQPATSYYYRFQALGERSPVGRTRTLPLAGAKRLRLALASCSNLPVGYFNAYARIAARPDLDAVLHLGDYIYEYAGAHYRDPVRLPQPDAEIVTLEDYRERHAQYKADPDLQAAHRQHPFIVVWDDHEIANDAWRDGAQNHQPEEGEWAARRAAAVRAYLEWMPIREDRATRLPRIYRTFPFGDLADLVMLDTRVIDRDRQAPNRQALKIVDDPGRSPLGRAQEAWLLEELVASQKAGVTWQLLGQQVMFAHLTKPGEPAGSVDTWDGYRPARERVLDAIASQNLQNVVVLTGDVHSSWAYDLARDPWAGYDPGSGRGTIAIEIVTPAITSRSGFSSSPPEQAAERMAAVRRARPHLRYLEGLSRGYVVLDVTRERVQADWFFVPTVTEPSAVERHDKGLVSAAGAPHLVEAGSPATGATGPDPAP